MHLRGWSTSNGKPKVYLLSTFIANCSPEEFKEMIEEISFSWRILFRVFVYYLDLYNNPLDGKLKSRPVCTRQLFTEAHKEQQRG